MDTQELFPRHIQRAVARKTPNLDRQGIYQYILLDHMRGREFEPSCLERALRRMRLIPEGEIQVKKLKVYHPFFPEDEDRQIRLWFLGHVKDRGQAKRFASDQLRPPPQRKTRVCQPTYLDAVFGVSKALPGAPCDVWWAIDIERPWFIARKKRPLVAIARFL